MKKNEGQNKSVWMGVVGGSFRPHHRFVAGPTFGLKASGAPSAWPLWELTPFLFGVKGCSESWGPRGETWAGLGPGLTEALEAPGRPLEAWLASSGDP